MLMRAAVHVVVLFLAVAAAASEGPTPASPGTPEKEAPKPGTVELRGKVSGPDGEPVSGATVRIRPAPPEEGRRSARAVELPEPTVLKSGEDGAFHAPELVKHRMPLSIR